MTASGPPAHLTTSSGSSCRYGACRHGQDHGVDAFQRRGQIVLDADIYQVLLIAEEPRPGMARRRVAVLRFEFLPVIDIRIVHPHFGAHFGEFAHDDFRAAVAGVADIFAIACAADEHVGAGDVLAHVAQGVACQVRPRAARGCR